MENATRDCAGRTRSGKMSERGLAPEEMTYKWRCGNHMFLLQHTDISPHHQKLSNLIVLVDIFLCELDWRGREVEKQGPWAREEQSWELYRKHSQFLRRHFFNREQIIAKLLKKHQLHNNHNPHNKNLGKSLLFNHWDVPAGELAPNWQINMSGGLSAL